jgi:sugar-specific transcriptional regulator TrmB/DNA-binding CsgD family transcriptional regulator
MLSVLGLEFVEEEIYRRLVTYAGATADELTAITGRPAREIGEALARLVARGIVIANPSIETPGMTTVYSAAPPAVALGGLLRHQRDVLDAAERDLAALVDEHRAASARLTATSVVEEITDITAVRHRYAQLQETAKREVLSMVPPNLRVVRRDENTAAMAALDRGVVNRVILDRKALDEPGMTNDVFEAISEGQEVRIADDVPVKMVIVDRERAMVPLLDGHGSTAASVLVQSSGLLDALIAYFEVAWDRAYPVLPAVSRPSVVETEPEIDELDARILALLLSGMTDQSVAGQLRTSRRTVQRRISDLMVKAGVDTRIELGWYAARKGWA